MDNPTPPTADTARRGGFGQIGTLLLGMIIGGALVAGLSNMGAVRKTEPPATDVNAIRAAARDGAREGAATAIAALPASQPVAQAPSAQVDTQQAPAADQIFNVDFRAANTQGDGDAPVTIIEYSDFECGFCRSFYNGTLKQIVDEYVQKIGRAHV